MKEKSPGPISSRRPKDSCATNLPRDRLLQRDLAATGKGVAMRAIWAAQAEVVLRKSRREKGPRAFRIENAPFQGRRMDSFPFPITGKPLHFKENRPRRLRRVSCPY